jgi:Flp pilus assembly pilin Flp
MKEASGMMKKMNNNGQGIVEYALILLLVVMAVITVLTVLGPAVGATFSRIIAAI